MINDFEMHMFVDISLLTLLLITAIAVVAFRHLLVVTILMTIFSLLMALMYLVMGAPDVAITEAAIGAGMSTVLLLATILLCDQDCRPSRHPLIPLVVVFATGAALVYATLGLPAYGDPDAAANTHVAPYYLHMSGEEMGIPNVVTSILASYRGYDTMGEVFVVFTAGVSVLMLLGTPVTSLSVRNFTTRRKHTTR